MKSQNKNITLSAKQKIQVTLWVQKSKELCAKQTAEELTDALEKELGFPVAPSTMNRTRNIIFPDLYRPRLKESNLLQRLEQLEASMAMLLKKNDVNQY